MQVKSPSCSPLGPATFCRIGSLLTVARLGTIEYDELVTAVKDFYDPKPSIIAQRFRFNTKQKNPTESVAAYVAAIRRLAEHCDFKVTLTEMFCDRFVCGVNHDTIQTQLLAEKDHTFEKALELAQPVKAAEKNTNNIQNGSTKPIEAHILYNKLVSQFLLSP